MKRLEQTLRRGRRQGGGGDNEEEEGTMRWRRGQ
tara:strand:- start:36 stop:137 length:102 start_codon:yes stop_codon:yes gene_type:complete